MHGLYKRFLVFCAVFVGLMFAVVGFWALLGVTCLCAGMVLVAASPLLLVGFGVCLAAVNLGDLLKEE
ncbi:hypothetical protein PMT39_01955 [Bifidobacterium longum]|jgi:hypothetical protein|uniref:hypothetical protein n=1 Tax=Bifidobacterium longum TaxID=216816 RepID=UPI00110660E0|nr:hypothetical protein [Bifidobacterium longum]MDB6874501.1 hypothetical protein [Bifidobacterium longum]MDB6881905.1 hypothetical protein [Bifidobacterium longum]MDB6884202.1 hypothetical protein [Bifidobacterium longum]